jgi:hypothetical protein
VVLVRTVRAMDWVMGRLAGPMSPSRSVPVPLVGLVLVAVATSAVRRSAVPPVLVWVHLAARVVLGVRVARVVPAVLAVRVMVPVGSGRCLVPARSVPGPVLRLALAGLPVAPASAGLRRVSRVVLVVLVGHSAALAAR